MRLVMTSPYPLWPASNGATKRTLGIARALARLGHQVTVLAPGKCPPAEENIRYESFLSLRGPAHFVNPFFERKLKQSLSKTKAQLVLSCFPYQALALSRVTRSHGVPLVYDAHNVESRRFKGRWGHGLVQKAEQTLIEHASAILSVSADEKAWFENRKHSAVFLLPNGVEQTTAKYGVRRRSLAYFGNFDYRPNVDGARFLLQRVWPQVSRRFSDLQCFLFGSGRKPRVRFPPNSVWLGCVEDVGETLAQIQLVVVPLFEGAGTRLKILEALANGCHVISTPKGAEGLPFGVNEGLWRVEASSFAQTMIEWLDQHSCGEANVSGAKAMKQVTWDKLVERVPWERFVRFPA